MQRTIQDREPVRHSRKEMKCKTPREAVERMFSHAEIVEIGNIYDDVFAVAWKEPGSDTILLDCVFAPSQRKADRRSRKLFTVSTEAVDGGTLPFVPKSMRHYINRDSVFCFDEVMEAIGIDSEVDNRMKSLDEGNILNLIFYDEEATAKRSYHDGYFRVHWDKMCEVTIKARELRGCLNYTIRKERGIRPVCIIR